MPGRSKGLGDETGEREGDKPAADPVFLEAGVLNKSE